jgi:hypothetical protein
VTLEPTDSGLHDIDLFHQDDPLRQLVRKPHKLVIVARRLVTIASAILKMGVLWRQNPVT